MNDLDTESRGSNRLRFSEPGDVFQLRVSLIDIEPLIWRRLLVPQDVTLPRLHTILQITMGWSDSHLHRFNVGDIRFGEPDEDSWSSTIDHRRITLNQIAPRMGSTFIYEYDFGDSWEHLVDVEQELPRESSAGAVPRCLGGERSCSPEDCGGPSGYGRIVEAIRDPHHLEHDEYLDWAGEQFDPEAFTVDGVNRLLARYASKGRLDPRERPPHSRPV